LDPVSCSREHLTAVNAGRCGVELYPVAVSSSVTAACCGVAHVRTHPLVSKNKDQPKHPNPAITASFEDTGTTLKTNIRSSSAVNLQFHGYMAD